MSAGLTVALIGAAGVVLAAFIGLWGALLGERTKRAVAANTAAFEAERLRLDNWERLTDAHLAEIDRLNAQVARLRAENRALKEGRQ